MKYFINYKGYSRVPNKGSCLNKRSPWKLGRKNPYSKVVFEGFPYVLWLFQEFLETMHQFANQGEEEKLSFLFKVNLICAPFVIFEYNTINMDFWLGVRSKWRWPNWWRRIKRHNCLMRCRERNGIWWTAGILNITIANDKKNLRGECICKMQWHSHKMYSGRGGGCHF